VGGRARGARRGSGETVRPGFGKSVRQSVRHLFCRVRRFEKCPLVARKPEQGDFFAVKERGKNDRLMASSAVLGLREWRRSEAAQVSGVSADAKGGGSPQIHSQNPRARSKVPHRTAQKGLARVLTFHPSGVSLWRSVRPAPGSALQIDIRLGGSTVSTPGSRNSHFNRRRPSHGCEPYSNLKPQPGNR
jgi:hypothetical protein